MSEVTQNDVRTLYDNASPERRAVLAQKLGHDLKVGDLSETETDLALAICEKLANDVELSVRQTLAQSIKSSEQIPRELALAMANDVLEVSLPMLEFSTVLEDEDLIAIARGGNVQRQLAITHRESLSPVLTYTLADECGEEVVSSLLKNDGAQMIEETYETVLNRFRDCPAIHTSMAERKDLPIHVIDKMIDLVSEQLKDYLLGHHKMSNVALERAVLQSREDAKRRLLSDPLSKRDVALLIKTLAKQEKLTPNLIFRALEVGDRDFFEHALAQRVGIPVNAARTLIKDPGEKGFAALYKKAELDKKDFPAIRYLVEAEYHNKRKQPITARPTQTSAHNEPDSWLTETAKPKKKWGLF